MHTDGFCKRTQPASKNPGAGLQTRVDRTGDHDAGEFCAENKGRFDVAPVVLVQALRIEEIDMS